MSKLIEHRRETFYCTCEDCKDHWPNIDCPCELCYDPRHYVYDDDQCWEVDGCACSKCDPNPPPPITHVKMCPEDWPNEEPTIFQKLFNFVLACFKC